MGTEPAGTFHRGASRSLRWAGGLATAAMVTANGALIAVILIGSSPPSFVFYHRSLQWACLGVAAGGGAVQLLVSRLVDAGWPTRTSTVTWRVLVVVWMFVPAAMLAVAPVGAGYSFSDCGTLLGRDAAARHPGADAVMEGLATRCDAAYAHRWRDLAIAAVAAVAVASMFLWRSRIRARRSGRRRPPAAG